jgi:hypothetical protein
MKKGMKLMLLLMSVAAATTLSASAVNAQIDPDRESIFGSTVIDTATTDDSWEGETGLYWHSEYPDEGDDGHAGWGFLDLKWESGPFHGFQVGAGALAIVEAWDTDGLEDVLDEEGAFADAAKWTQAYVKYTIPDTETQFLIGRAEGGAFGKPNGGDGDYFQGIGVTVKDIPRLTLKAHVVNKWLNNASPHWNLDGIDDDWQSMDDVIREVGGGSEDAGDVAYTLMADIDLIPDRLTLTPSVQHLEDVVTSLGITLDGEMAVTESLTVGGKSIYLHHFEDTPADVSADDDDLSQFLVQIFGKFSGLKAGIGYYTISDDIAIFNTRAEGGDDFEDVFVMDEIDPLEEDLAKYGEQPNSETWFLFAEYGYGPFDLEAIYGWVDDAVIEDGFTYQGEAQELNLILGIGLTKNLAAELAYIYLHDDYEADGDRSMDIFAGSLSYAF